MSNSWLWCRSSHEKRFTNPIKEFYEGRVNGIQAQKVADYGAIKIINDSIAAQNNKAAQELQAATDAVITKQSENASIKLQLEQEHQTNAQITHKLNVANSTISLFFRPDNATGRKGSGGPDIPSPHPTSDPTAGLVQIPDSVATNLHNLAYDCDTLSDDYTLLYNWAHSLK